MRQDSGADPRTGAASGTGRGAEPGAADRNNRRLKENRRKMDAGPKPCAAGSNNRRFKIAPRTSGAHVSTNEPLGLFSTSEPAQFLRFISPTKWVFTEPLVHSRPFAVPYQVASLSVLRAVC